MDVIEPGWLSLLPPLAAIALALITREVVVSLFAGIWLGALFVADWNPVTATLMSVDEFALQALAGSADHVAIVLFSLLLGGMGGPWGWWKRCAPTPPAAAEASSSPGSRAWPSSSTITPTP